MNVKKFIIAASLVIFIVVSFVYAIIASFDESRYFSSQSVDYYLLIHSRIVKDFPFPEVYVHSANPIGAANIMGYINNFLMNEAQPQTCVRVSIPHTVDE